MRLILMRHAKSDWADAGLSDHGRPLNDRGRRDAPRIAGWMAENGCQPDFLLSSDSIRTRQTATYLMTRWGVDVPSWFSSELYLASAASMLQTLRDQASKNTELRRAVTVLVLAHNPGISEAAGHLTQAPVAMPTCALMALDCEIDDWAQTVDPANCRESHFMKPKSLP